MYKISVVIPSFNQGRYIEETLLSVLSQDYPLTEIIVIDGGSTDETTTVIRKYEQHIYYWISEKDKGQSDAINKGFDRATGDIITWLCSDDLFMPGTLHKVNAHFEKLPESAGLIHGGVKSFSDTVPEIAVDFGYSNPSVERYLAGMAFSQPAAFFRRKYLLATGNKTNTALHYGMDYDLFSRLACVCDFVPVQDLYAGYRLHGESKTMSHQNRFIKDWNRVFINLCKNLGWEEITARAKQTGFFDDAFLSSDPFTFAPRTDIAGAVSGEKVYFYHLCYTFKAYYWAADYRMAKKYLLT